MISNLPNNFLPEFHWLKAFSRDVFFLKIFGHVWNQIDPGCVGRSAASTDTSRATGNKLSTGTGNKSTGWDPTPASALSRPWSGSVTADEGSGSLDKSPIAGPVPSVQTGALPWRASLLDRRFVMANSRIYRTYGHNSVNDIAKCSSLCTSVTVREHRANWEQFINVIINNKHLDNFWRQNFGALFGRQFW